MATETVLVQTEQMARAALKELGLGKLALDVSYDQMGRDIRIYLAMRVDSTQLEVGTRLEKCFDIIFGPLFEDIKKSPYMKGLTEGLEKELAISEKEVERLQKFETYYRMEQGMRHGTPPEALKL